MTYAPPAIETTLVETVAAELARRNGEAIEHEAWLSDESMGGPTGRVRRHFVGPRMGDAILGLTADFNAPGGLGHDQAHLYTDIYTDRDGVLHRDSGAYVTAHAQRYDKQPGLGLSYIRSQAFARHNDTAAPEAIVVLWVQMLIDLGIGDIRAESDTWLDQAQQIVDAANRRIEAIVELIDVTAS